MDVHMGRICISPTQRRPPASTSIGRVTEHGDIDEAGETGESTEWFPSPGVNYETFLKLKLCK